ncbi:MAG: response regulator, partial [Fibrobacter sp.]|nr:response regulator [Fibrobacter sp.]
MSSQSDQQQKLEKILIVDDNEQTATFIKFLIDEAGFICKVANTANKALEIIRSEAIDLVLLDVVMPDMDGITAAGTIKSISGKEFIPVILVTALSADEDKVAGLTHADDYITKPFSGDELLARIGSLLRIRRLHKELSLSKFRYQSLYENFPHLYISVDEDKKIVDCNRFFRETFDVTRDEVAGQYIHSFFKSEEAEMFEHFLRSFAISDIPMVHQGVFRLNGPKQTEPRLINVKAVYIGEVESGLSTVIAMEDVTRQTQLQEQQKIARKQLYRSARLASIGTLASGVAHELNNPLTAILGFSSVLVERIETGEQINESEFKQYLQIINNEALRCRDIVENLSKFAREGDSQIRNIDLDNCIRDALKLTNSRMVRKNIHLSYKLPENVRVNADANKLEQVIINIISNSLDFCPEYSTIEIAPV